MKKFNEQKNLEAERNVMMALSKVSHCAQLYMTSSEIDEDCLPVVFYGKGDLYSFNEHCGIFEERLAKVIFRQLLVGIENIHSRGIAHRDIKPENVFVDDDYNVQIGDFGLANFVDANFLVKDVCGTKSYMAPEGFKTAPHDGLKADMWSLGCLFFTMLVGNCPFGDEGAQSSDWFYKQLKHNRKEKFWEQHERYALGLVSARAKQFLESILVVDPLLRPSSEELLSHPWLSEDAISEQEFFLGMQRLNARMCAERGVVGDPRRV